MLVLTNGHTEEEYFNGLKRRLGHEVALTVRYQNGDPDALLRGLGKKGRPPTEYDEIWLVVDHDGTDRTSFLSDCRKRSRVHAVVSVPCFEVWLIAHYTQVRRYQGQKQAQQHYLKVSGLSEHRPKQVPRDFPWDAVEDATHRCLLQGQSLPSVDAQGPCPSTTMPHLLASVGLITLAEP